MKILVKCHDRAVIIESITIEFSLDGKDNTVRIWRPGNDYLDIVLSSCYNIVNFADRVYHSSYPLLYADSVQWSGDEDD